MPSARRTRAAADGRVRDELPGIQGSKRSPSGHAQEGSDACYDIAEPVGEKQLAANRSIVGPGEPGPGNRNNIRSFTSQPVDPAPRGQEPGGRSENVAAMESIAHGEPPDPVGAGDSGFLNGSRVGDFNRARPCSRKEVREYAVVRTDTAESIGLDCQRPSGRSHPRVYNGKEDRPLRHVRQGLPETERGTSHVPGWYLVCQVDKGRVRRYPGDHGLHDSGVDVLRAEIAHERNTAFSAVIRHVKTRLSLSRNIHYDSIIVEPVITERMENGSRRLRDLVQAIQKDADGATLRRVVGKSIAVSSGKGGVGKTITACNLAIYYARKGMRVGLVDLDPLSDVAALLDLQDSEDVLTGGSRARTRSAVGLAAYQMPVFKGLEILFPFQKLARGEAAGMIEKIYRMHLHEVDRLYDLLIFDMPAGMSYEDNLVYLPFMNRLVLVTNPEPTAHASAGAYVKEVQRLYPGTPIRLWHNRYTSRVKDGFNPSDVAGNYNRLVDPSDRLSAGEQNLLSDFAFIPEDPALDLLQGEPSPALHVLSCMRDGLDHVHGRLLSHASRGLHVPRGVKEILTLYVHRNPRIGEAAEYLERLGSYLREVIEATVEPGVVLPGEEQALFSPAEQRALEDFLLRMKDSALRQELVRLEGLLADRISQIDVSRRTMAGVSAAEQDRAVDRELGRFLVTANRAARRSPVMRSHGTLLLFYFSLQAVPVPHADLPDPRAYPTAAQPEGPPRARQVQADPHARGGRCSLPGALPEDR